MTDQLHDTDDFLTEDEPIVLTYRGKDYEIRPATARTGLDMRRLFAATERAQNGEELSDRDKEILNRDSEDVWQELLGDTFDELMDDGVTFGALDLIGNTAVMWAAQDRDMALEFWENEGKAPAPNRAQRRAAKTRTGGATTTKRQASGTGTSTRPSRSASKPKAEA